MNKKTVSEQENALIYADFNSAKRKMAIGKIAFNLAQQEFDDFGWHLHDEQYWKIVAGILYDRAVERGVV